MAKPVEESSSKGTLKEEFLFWPALQFKRPQQVHDLYFAGPLAHFRDQRYPLPRDWPELARSPIVIEIRPCCHSDCHANGCKCGSIARLKDVPTDEIGLDVNEVLAVVTINTSWLRRVKKETMLKAAESLVFGHLPSDMPAAKFRMVETGIAYTERLLPLVRRHIGSTDIWESHIGSDLTDFSTIAMGA